MHTFRPGISVFLVVLALSAVAGAQQTAGGYQVNAAYLYNFAKMAHWPAATLPDASDLVIRVYGGNEDFISVLRNILAGKIISGHPLEIRQLRSPQEVKFCHVVFFRASERTTKTVIEQLGKSSVLLVGEDKAFLSQGGMINLSLEDGKISYEVNSAALERAGLHFGDTNSANSDTGVPAVQPENSRSIAFQAKPEYPRLAAALNLAGAVQLQAVVRADGTVKEVRVVGGHPVLAEAAAAAVRHWRYEPGARETIEAVRVSFGQ
jgi:TonB family protein